MLYRKLVCPHRIFILFNGKNLKCNLFTVVLFQITLLGTECQINYSLIVACRKVDALKNPKRRPHHPSQICMTGNSTCLLYQYCIPMPAKLPDDVVYRIQVRLKCGESSTAIQRATQVSIRTIQRMRLNLDLFGQPYTPPSVVLGRPRALLPARTGNV